MMGMFRSLLLGAAVIAVLSMFSPPAWAQGGATTSSIAGTVVDASGGVIPGADVTVKQTSTGTTYTTVTGSRGEFNVPALQIGAYSVTVALMGFKTAVVNDVPLTSGAPASVRVVLEVGALEETILVQGGSEIVQTTSAAVAATLNVKAVTNLPLNSRSALDFVAFLPGVDTASTVRDSTVLGLPQSAINITIDGMNVQDNYLKTSDGFFTRVTPRLDAIEEVTFTSAAQGADSAGQGAVQIRFATRSGSNEYRGSTYYYYRNEALNSNTWFGIRDGLPKQKQNQKQYGGRLGGPMSIPGWFDARNKAFFFFNYEEFRQPSETRRNRVILAEPARQGTFLYGSRQVDLLALARANGQIATIDPVVAKLLADIRASTQGVGSINALTNRSTEQFSYLSPQKSNNKYPTVRLDFNLPANNRLSFSTNYQHIYVSPDTNTNSRDPRFPGFPAWGLQDSKRYTWQTTLRSTLGKSMVNEARVGRTGGATLFNPNYGIDMWSGGGTGLADTKGYQLNINGTMGLTNAASSTTPSSREASTFVLEDSLSWLKGSHNLSFGASYTRVDVWLKNQTLVPTINFGMATGDPAISMFTTANFPGAATADLTNAQNLYALLTGRITAINRDARIDEASNKYALLGASKAAGRMHDLGLYAQDSWRIRRNLTLTLGARYEIQLPFFPLNNSYSNNTIEDLWGATGVAPDFQPGALVNNIGHLFQPGTLQGSQPYYREFKKGTNAYNTDWNNFAPNIGAAWTPYVESGFLRKLLGNDGDTVIRGGFTTAFQRNGMSDFTGVYGANPGIQITANRNQSEGTLGTVPLFFSGGSGNLGQPSFPDERTYPMLPPTLTGSVNMFDPDLQVPFARTWTVGMQRAITQNTAVEVRYTGSHNYQGWTEYDYNETNIVENGFLKEFGLAQQNLRANIAAGRGNNFRYYGAGTGTSPLPIYLAFFSGIPASRAGDASLYSSSNFASSNYYNHLALLNPNPYTAAGTGTTGLMGNATLRTNAAAAGLPRNFFLANPDMLGGANLTGNGGYTDYDGLTAEIRRRMAKGLQFAASYTYGISYDSSRFSFRRERIPLRQTGNLGGVQHAFKTNWVYELPFGRGRRFLSDANGFVDRLVGGWSFFGTGRVQSGRLLDFGNVRLVGMTKEEFANLFEVRTVADATGKLRVWMLPDDVMANTVKAFNVSATSPTGYGTLGAPTGKYLGPANSVDCIEVVSGWGDCGDRSVVVTGPLVANFDFSFGKQVPIKGRVNFEFQWQVFNVFNRAQFTPITGFNTNANRGLSSSTQDTFEVLGLALGAREMQLVFRLNF